MTEINLLTFFVLMMRFDKKYYQYLETVLIIGLYTVTCLPVTSRKRKIIANYVQNRAYRERNERSGKCYDVTYRARGGENKNAPRVFKGGFHGFPWGITTTLRRFRGGCGIFQGGTGRRWIVHFTTAPYGTYQRADILCRCWW